MDSHIQATNEGPPRGQPGLELFEPPGQEPPLGGRGGQLQRPAVRRPGLVVAAETPQQFAAALAQAGDPTAALTAVDRLDLDGYLYFHSTRGELLRRLGRDAEARAAYRRALELATSTPERRFLARRLEQL